MSRRCHYLLIGLSYCMVVPGCDSRSSQSASSLSSLAEPRSLAEPPAERSWQAAIEAVANGSTQTIHMNSTVIVDSQIAELRETLQLETLILDVGQVSDQALVTLATIESLVHLRLRKSSIGDTGLKNLAQGRLVNLRILNLPQSTITALGARYLEKMPALRQLRLGGATIDDAAVEQIARIATLESLHLIGPKLTDGALESLAAMPNLSSFYLDDCQLSDQAWKNFFKVRPAMHVHIDQQHHDRDPAKHQH